ncbi:MAG TPA: hypothetical protein VFV38_18675 [Ktedonobacteraceae bacterium]|nr:hypothetical protein [Ktedonobacteraceae bacterium]
MQQPDRVRRVSAAETTRPVTTLDPADVSSWVLHTPLVSPLHLGAHLRCLDYVVVPMTARLSIGEHTRDREMLYYLDQGGGTLTRDGHTSRIQASDLILAPAGTQAWLANDTREPLCLLAIGVQALLRPAATLQVLTALPEQCEPSNQRMATVGQQPVLLNGGQLALTPWLTRVWGKLFLLELPAEASLTFTEPEYDENVFVVRGQASIQLHLSTMEAPFHTSPDPTAGLNVLIPAGVFRHITNTSATEALWLLIVQVCHA